MKIDRKSLLLTAGLAALLAPSAGLLAAELPSLGSEPVGSARLVSGESLEDFFTAALDYSPRLRIAEEGMNIGSARKQAATGQLLPTVQANGSLSDNRRDQGGQVTNFDGQRYSLQLSQVLFNWRAFSARKQALLIEDQLEAQYYYELATVLTDVADRYFSVLQAQDALDSIASEREAVQNQLDQIQSLYDRQLAQITDLYQAQASLAAIGSQQLQLESELAIASESLRSISGIDVGELYQLETEVEIPEVEQDIDYWADQARINNQQIEASEYALRAADERISERRGSYMPEVSFIAQRQDSNLGFDNAPISQTDTTYYGLNVSIPIYAGGANRARVREARSQRNIAENELRQVELETNESVRTAYLQVQASASRTESAQVLSESTALSAEAMQQGFNLGVVTSVDLLNALRDQFQAERDFQRARYDHVRYLLQLKREAGLLVPADLVEVSSWLTDSANQ
ncbi:MAG: TolC family protein [Gammaproteobacteria bacterium]